METKIKIPDDVEVEVNEDFVEVKGQKGSIKKRFYHPKMNIKKSGKEIIITTKKDIKKTIAIVGAWKSHLENMFKGVNNEYEYRMKISYVHFPMSVAIEGNDFIIKNYLGQKANRHAKILEGVDVKIDGEDVIIRGIDKEKVGQTAGNIENATRLKKRRDRRKFSDGIYITSKGEEQ
ncbi:MAG: 50S ribosomal protein L6 [Candidatus Aenigmarchaeota archaeon]|nr:50S ribosomal protein L6 [Candidatus Aenigmarchaeota archaeon]